MRANGTFSVKAFVPTELKPEPAVATGLPVGVATMEKHFEGEVAGRSATLFTAAYDQQSGVGTYVAMESFEGSLHGRSGAFNFVHSATTSGSDRTAEFFTIVPSSGIGDLAGISGTGALAVDADGTHRIRLDYGSADVPVQLTVNEGHIARSRGRQLHTKLTQPNRNFRFQALRSPASECSGERLVRHGTPSPTVSGDSA